MGCRQTKVVPVAESVARRKMNQHSDKCVDNKSDSAGSGQLEMPRTAHAPLVRAGVPNFTRICWGVEQLPVQTLPQRAEACTSVEAITKNVASLPRPRAAHGRRRAQRIFSGEKACADSSAASAVLKRPTAAVHTRRPTRVAYTRHGADEWTRDPWCAGNRFDQPRSALVNEADKITVRPLAARCCRRRAWYENAPPPARLHRYN